jgi:NADH-quinone oxidoreductase subunit E
MSVRRLAEEAVQPESFAFNRAMTREAKTWIGKYPKGRQASAVIPLLMLAQEQEGWVSRAAIEHVAQMLGMPYIRVLEVATFYTQFQLKPVGTRAHVQVCGTTPCMLRGSEALMDVCRSKIHPEQFHTNAAGRLSWEEVECQGACVNAPMVMIFKDTYEDLTPERLAEIIDAFEAGKGGSIAPGPQIDRIFSAPQGGLTSLVSDPTVRRGKAAAKAEPAKPAKAAKAKTASVPPSNAALPKTASPMTAAAIRSPADKTGAKVKPAKEEAASLVSRDRPAAVDKPKQPDDLKLISGVGPKLEGVLNGLGIWTFAQVASWKKAERDWVDGYLKFKGRIERDDWVKQAKALAKGGEAEYIRVFGKKPR